MILNEKGITADAIALQEHDEFRGVGWLKLIAPAKVNLFLGIGAPRSDGYHDVYTVMHALTLHDTLYMRKKMPADASYGTNEPSVQLVPTGGFELPTLDPRDNLATKAVQALGEAWDSFPDACDLMIRIEKNIPFQGGLGGASTDAAAALAGAAALNGYPLDDPRIENAARIVGADVAFFLHGGCAYFEGVGDIFHHALTPASTPLALIKPDAGVSTVKAYQTFDSNPVSIDPPLLEAARTATAANEVPLFNNLAPAAEELLPELNGIRLWASAQRGVTNVLLCGSGATTFVLCDSMDDAVRIATDARKQGYWARATSLSSIGARPLLVGD